MSETNFTLKYLFHVEYIDGTKFEQPQDDDSKLKPGETSAFYDVLNSDKTVRKFTLKEVKGKKSISVDLFSGEFEVNGIPIYTDLLPYPLKRDLIFYRQHQHDTQATYELKTGELIKNIPGDHRVRYFVGWQVNVGGKNYQQKIGVD